MHKRIIPRPLAAGWFIYFPDKRFFSLKESKSFEVEWVIMELHEEAVKELERIGKRGVSLVDCTSFLVMRRRGVNQVLAFDPDFQEQGFSLY
jgi:predicted nucleic acid-binding protein